MCSRPYNITLGDNAFNNAPANNVNLDTVGTPCNFASTGYSFSYNSVYYRFTPSVTGRYTFNLCNQVSAALGRNEQSAPERHLLLFTL